MEEAPPGVRAVDGGRFVQVYVDSLEPGHEHDHEERDA